MQLIGILGKTFVWQNVPALGGAALIACAAAEISALASHVVA
jgi:hypothetical protein